MIKQHNTLCGEKKALLLRFANTRHEHTGMQDRAKFALRRVVVTVNDRLQLSKSGTGSHAARADRDWTISFSAVVRNRSTMTVTRYSYAT